MKNDRLSQHKFGYFIVLLLGFVAVMAICLPSCSSSKKYGQVEHKRSSYRDVRVKQPRWNTTTSTSTTYYIKKQKPRKRYNP
ncbi:MAG: hypothetical protein IKP54_01540 [Bacteroidales bacterium]|nr:hypothetical protein [Bacteroidota bacterium]MBQ9508272.1 hypothetical protein [Bacteroidales bacterium]MBR6062833.1 hypothetical protein [Bacteroidales bacterium]